MGLVDKADFNPPFGYIFQVNFWCALIGTSIFFIFMVTMQVYVHSLRMWIVVHLLSCNEWIINPLMHDKNRIWQVIFITVFYFVKTWSYYLGITDLCTKFHAMQGERSHTVQRQFNTKTKEQEEHQEFINLDESKCERTWVLLHVTLWENMALTLSKSNFVRMAFIPYLHMWQSQVEIKHYSVAYFDHVTVFEAL